MYVLWFQKYQGGVSPKCLPPWTPKIPFLGHTFCHLKMEKLGICVFVSCHFPFRNEWGGTFTRWAVASPLCLYSPLIQLLSLSNPLGPWRREFQGEGEKEKWESLAVVLTGGWGQAVGTNRVRRRDSVYSRRNTDCPVSQGRSLGLDLRSTLLPPPQGEAVQLHRSELVFCFHAS